MTAYLLRCEIPNLLISLFMFIFLIYNHFFHRTTNRLFFAVAAANLVLIVSDSLRYLAANGAVPFGVHAPACAVSFTARIVLTALFCLIFSNHLMREKVQLAVFAIPGVINAVLSFLSIKYGFIFTSVAGEFKPESGAFYIVPFLASAFYLFIAVGIVFKRFNHNELRESLGIFVCLLFVVAATVLEAGFGHLGLISGAANVGLTFVFVTLHGGMGSKDALTGCFTRKRYYQDLESSKLTAVIMIDLNGLKSINDRYGHLEGDKKLAGLASVCFACKKGKCDFYRLGGDEFSILCFSQSERVVSDMVHDIKRETSISGISCAVGYAMTSIRESVRDTCANADAMMYRDKAETKNLMTERNRMSREVPLFSDHRK